MKKAAQVTILLTLFVLEIFLLVLIFKFYGLYQSKQIAMETIVIEEAAKAEEKMKETEEDLLAEDVPKEESVKVYKLYEDGEFAGEFESFTAAKAAVSAKGVKAGIEITENGDEVFDDRNNFLVIKDGELLSEFESYLDALWYAKKNINSKIILRTNEAELWSFGYTPPKTRMLEAEAVMQLPELARGCEVTSLAMLLDYAGIAADKVKLAEEIAKNKDFFGWRGAKKYSGDPNEGFIGDIYSFDNDGLGVYNKPIFELAKKYTDTAIELTGCGFEDIYDFIGKGRPVWVIINGEYNALPQSEFETWYKKDGTEMKITYREHSVLLTGYDEEFLYFNDPLTGKSKAPAAEFKAGWEQMGCQAISLASAK